MESKNAAGEIARPKRTAPQCYIFGSLNQVRFSEPHDHYLCFNFKSKDITTQAPRGYPDFCELLRIHRRTIDEILVGEGKRELRHRFAHIRQGDQIHASNRRRNRRWNTGGRVFGAVVRRRHSRRAHIAADR